MNTIKSTLKLAMILYICVALTGVYALSASARITPLDSEEETKLITIEKGDTLWDLCQKYLEDPLKWRELSKYNDFTNPNLIYPGEKLRIPLSMAIPIADKAEEDVKEQQEELEKLHANLAESEAERDKLMAEIKGLNDTMAELKKKIGELEASQKSQEKVIEAVKKANTDSANNVNKTVRNTRNTLQSMLDTLNDNLDSANQMLSNLQKELKATQDQIKAVQADVKTALANIETNKNGIAQLKMLIVDAQGVHEEVSTNKRALVFITTIAAGIGLFVLNTIGGRGE